MNRLVRFSTQLQARIMRLGIMVGEVEEEHGNVN